jgi:hypothetical protein
MVQGLSSHVESYSARQVIHRFRGIITSANFPNAFGAIACTSLPLVFLYSRHESVFESTVKGTKCGPLNNLYTSLRNLSEWKAFVWPIYKLRPFHYRNRDISVV